MKIYMACPDSHDDPRVCEQRFRAVEGAVTPGEALDFLKAGGHLWDRGWEAELFFRNETSTRITVRRFRSSYTVEKLYPLNILCERIGYLEETMYQE